MSFAISPSDQSYVLVLDSRGDGWGMGGDDLPALLGLVPGAYTVCAGPSESGYQAVCVGASGPVPWSGDLLQVPKAARGQVKVRIDQVTPVSLTLPPSSASPQVSSAALRALAERTSQAGGRFVPLSGDAPSSHIVRQFLPLLRRVG